MSIHPTAIIDPKAELGSNVTVGPYSVIGPDVTIGDGTDIGPQVCVEKLTTIGKKCRIFKGASVGSAPQDLKYADEPTTLEIGDNTTVREFCTLNRGTTAHMKSVIGSNCLLMAYAHVAHDCVVGDNAILANAVQLGGHVTIGDWAIIGGSTPVHQFTKIGAHAIIGGGYRAVQDVPPFIAAAGEPLRYGGVNSIGMSRRGFSREQIALVKRAYRYVFRKGLKKAEYLDALKTELDQTDEIKTIIRFIEESERGII